ncbi:hypothetical protein GCM10025877_12730 [Agromyces mangrovi Wang et al. 2018]|nr:hypothetical protein GCM10025877_12730 [Agromyces mangrovi]
MGCLGAGVSPDLSALSHAREDTPDQAGHAGAAACLHPAHTSRSTCQRNIPPSRFLCYSGRTNDLRHDEVPMSADAPPAPAEGATPGSTPCGSTA